MWMDRTADFQIMYSDFIPHKNLFVEYSDKLSW